MAFPSSSIEDANGVDRLVGDNQADHDPRRKRAKSPAPGSGRSECSCGRRGQHVEAGKLYLRLMLPDSSADAA
jgi:hypothetical protein